MFYQPPNDPHTNYSHIVKFLVLIFSLWMVFTVYSVLSGKQVVASASASEYTVTDTIYSAASDYGVDGDRMVRVAVCESGLNPTATNPNGHYGLFQFSPRTWAYASRRAGYGGASVYDPEANAYAAAWLITNVGWGQFACKG